MANLDAAKRKKELDFADEKEKFLEQEIARLRQEIEKLKAAESVSIPEWLEYGAISGLSREMREKLERVRPGTIQSSRTMR